MVMLVATSIILFMATNIDDLFFLMTWFSQAKTTEQKLCIAGGQYLGFLLLLITSMLGAFGTFLIQKEWVGLLGLLPIYIGIKSLIMLYRSRSEQINVVGWLLKTAAITFANGSDNIGVYIPYFSTNSLENLMLILFIFLALVAVWCYIGNLLSNQPFIAQILERNGHIIVPIMLILLGVYILIKQGTVYYIF